METRDLTGEPEQPEETAPRLEPLVKRIFVGVAFSALGNGLTMPFLSVYPAEVRGIAIDKDGHPRLSLLFVDDPLPDRMLPPKA